MTARVAKDVNASTLPLISTHPRRRVFPRPLPRYDARHHMAKPDPQLDVLVIGEHPASYLAAALLRHKTHFRIAHATLPEQPPHDRLVLVNPNLFNLHALLEPLRRKLHLHAIYGVQFLADEPPTACEYRSKPGVNGIAQFKDVRAAMRDLASAQGVEFHSPKTLRILRLDEKGIDITLGQQSLRPRAVVLADPLTADQQRQLGMPEEWERGVVHRYTFAVLKLKAMKDMGTRPLMPMSLDLAGQLLWAWLLPGDRSMQLAVEQPISTVHKHKPLDLLRHWAAVLLKHGVLVQPPEISPDSVQSLDLPLAGALAHEGVANRTLLIGPAGGFYSASGEDIYPNCWSAIHAADVMKKALKEEHLQDALQPYRQKWRTTLGNYLRGPQQNLRFLLPLVYRNQVMTNRMAEAILIGKSVVR